MRVIPCFYYHWTWISLKLEMLTLSATNMCNCVWHSVGCVNEASKSKLCRSSETCCMWLTCNLLCLYSSLYLEQCAMQQSTTARPELVRRVMRDTRLLARTTTIAISVCWTGIPAASQIFNHCFRWQDFKSKIMMSWRKSQPVTTTGKMAASQANQRKWWQKADLWVRRQKACCHLAKEGHNQRTSFDWRRLW